MEKKTILLKLYALKMKVLKNTYLSREMYVIIWNTGRVGLWPETLSTQWNKRDDCKPEARLSLGCTLKETFWG